MPRKVVNSGTAGFYGWFALAGAMIAAFIDTGAFGYSYGVFLPTICDEFGWSRAVVSFGLTLGMLCFGLPSTLTGYLVSRFGPRGNLIFGNLLAALSLAGMSLVQEVWQVYLLYSLAGLGAGIGGYIPAITTVNNWFVKKRSLATGIFIAATSVSGFAFPPIITVLISSIGWRMSWVVLGGIVLAGASVIGGLILVRNRPEDMGQVPDGIPAESSDKDGAAGSVPEAGLGAAVWTTRQAMKQPSTWLIGAFAATNLFAFHSMIGHQIAYMRDSGFGPVIAAFTLSLVSGTGVLGSLGFGTLALRMNMKNLVSASFAVRLISMGLLLTTDNLALIYVYSILFGVSNGAIQAAMPTMLGAYYGRAPYAQILGLIFTMQITAGAIGPAVTGAIYDATGTYSTAFILITAFSVLGLICAFTARQPELPPGKGYR